MISKLGLVLECDAGGPDELAFHCLVRRLSPGTALEFATMGSKAGLFIRGVDAARDLIEAGNCALALIVWDLKPLWGGPPLAKKCEDEAAQLREKLLCVPEAMRGKIRLLCLTYELETWLMTEDRAVREYLSTPSHPFKFKAPGNPLSKSDPKQILNAASKEAKGQKYVDYLEAIRLVQR